MNDSAMRRRCAVTPLLARLLEPAHRLPVDLTDHLDEIGHAIIGRPVDVAEIDDGAQEREDSDGEDQEEADHDYG